MPICKPMNAPATPTSALVLLLIAPIRVGNHGWAYLLNTMLATTPIAIVVTKLANGAVATALRASDQSKLHDIPIQAPGLCLPSLCPPLASGSRQADCLGVSNDPGSCPGVEPPL